MIEKKRRGRPDNTNSFRRIKAVEEVNFDLQKRHEYLTGFRKRKQQRIKHAQQEAAKQERDDKIQQRKELREERKREVEEHVKAVNMALEKAEASTSAEKDDDANINEVWNGIDEECSSLNQRRENKYSDSEDEEAATVTIENINITRYGLERDGNDGSDALQETEENERKRMPSEKLTTIAQGRRWTKGKLDGVKKKRKKFRYESTAERKQSRAVQRAIKVKNKAKRESK